MENDIAIYAAGYVALRLGIAVTFGFFLYRMATMSKTVKISEESQRPGFRSVQRREEKL
jgi:hypothetical protein